MEILVIGTGSIGERHVRCFLATNRAQIAIVEPNEQLRNTIRDRYKLQHAWPTLDEALARHKFQAAVIATPAPLHIPIATRLAQAGVHVLIEKPLSVTLEGIPELQSILAEKKLTAVTAYVLRSYPVLAEMRQAIHEGRFGAPLQIVGVAGQNFPTYRPAYAKTYYASRASGGGAVQDAMTHLMNTAEWFGGPVTRLVADLDHKVLADVNVEDTVHVIARHGAVMGMYSLNQHQSANEFTVTVICPKATVRLELHNNRWGWMEKPDGGWNYAPSTPLERDTAFSSQASAFMDCIEHAKAPRCSLAEGLQTLKVNRAILASVESGTWQTIQG